MTPQEDALLGQDGLHESERWVERPTHQPWPGVGVSEGWHDANQRAKIRGFDDKLKDAKTDTKARLEAAIDAKEVPAVRRLRARLKFIREDRLPAIKSRTSSGAPIVAPGGRTKEPLLPSGDTGWWRKG